MFPSTVAFTFESSSRRSISRKTRDDISLHLMSFYRRSLKILLLPCLLIFLANVDGFSRPIIGRSTTRGFTISTRHTDVLVAADLRLFSTQEADNSVESSLSPRRISYLSIWFGLIGYSTYFSSQISPEAEAASAKILNTAIFSPFDGYLSPVFVTLFLFLGILPTIYGSILLPSSKRQKIWALPFVASSFALGFFGIGPYLGLRNKSPTPESLCVEDRDSGSALFDNKITPYFLLASAIYLIYFALTGAYDGSDRWGDYMLLFNTQPLARISTIDFTILSLAVSNFS